MFPSDSDSPRVPILALPLAMSPERLDPKAPLLHRHVLFSTRGVLENHPLHGGSNPSKSKLAIQRRAPSTPLRPQ